MQVLCWLDAPLTYPDFLEGVARVANALLAHQHDNLKVRAWGGRVERGCASRACTRVLLLALAAALAAADDACVHGLRPHNWTDSGHAQAPLPVRRALVIDPCFACACAQDRLIGFLTGTDGLQVAMKVQGRTNPSSPAKSAQAPSQPSPRQA